MKRTRLKELLTPIVREALDKYAKDKYEDEVDMQKKHPYLDMKNLPNVAGTIRAGTAMENVHSPKHPYTVRQVVEALVKKGYPPKKIKEFLTRKYSHGVKLETEASSTAGGAAGPFNTPYAFSNVGLDADKKKKKIATQLGMKILDPKKSGEDYAGLTEERKYRMERILEGIVKEDVHKPTISGSDARQLYMKMLDYLLMVDDPKFEKIKSFRKLIDKLTNPRDKEEMKKYFESEFGRGMSTLQGDVWNYYK